MFVTRVFVRCLVLLAIVASPLAQADAISEIVERGTLRVGIAEFVPWAMPAKRGGHTGYDIDLGVKIAKDMGVRAEFKVYEWKDIIPALEAGEVDMIAAGIVVTPQRALRINFTQPVAESGAGMATNTFMTKAVHEKAKSKNQEPAASSATIHSPL